MAHQKNQGVTARAVAPFFIGLCSKFVVERAIERTIEDSESRGLVGGVKVGVAKWHLEILVSEQFPDRRQIHPAHYEMGSEGMPQIVEVKILDPRPG